MLQDPDDIFGSNDDDILKKSESSNPSTPKIGNMPSYLTDAARRFLEENPNALDSMYNASSGTNIVPPAVRYFTDISSIFAYHASVGSSSSVYRSIVSILEEMTGGEVQRRSHIFELERLLIAAFHNISIANNIYINITNSEHPATTGSVQFIGYITKYLDIQAFTVNRLTEDYIQACNISGKQPDESILHYGLVDFADFTYMSGSAFPAYSKHYLLGDVEEISKSRFKNVEYLSDILSRLVFIGDPIVESNDLVNNETSS